MRYDPHNALIDPARPSSHPLRLLIGVLLTAFLYMFLEVFVFGFAAGFIAKGGDITAAWNALVSAATPGTALFQFYSFILMIFALWLVLKVVHNRTLFGLFGPRRACIRQFLRVSAYLLVLQVLFFALPATDALPISPGLDFSVWLGFLPFALIGLLIQVCAEELVFRGYIQSQLAARFPHPLIWIGLPSLIFGWLHYDPEFAGQNAWAVAVFIGLFAAANADLTARSGTLGPAIALHFFNNITALLISAPLGAFSGLALYTYPLSAIQHSEGGMIFALDFMFLLISWLTARLALRR